MTTIICDVTRKIIGADSGQVDGNLRRTTTKIVQLDCGIAAWSGEHQSGLQWIRWLRAHGFSPEGRPEPIPELNALLLRFDGLYHYENLCMAAKVSDDIYGIGSGSQFGMAALACGKSMEEALHVAAYFDLYTAPPFIIYDLRDASEDENGHMLAEPQLIEGDVWIPRL